MRTMRVNIRLMRTQGLVENKFLIKMLIMSVGMSGHDADDEGWIFRLHCSRNYAGPQHKNH